MSAVDPSHPEKVVDDLFAEVLKTFSMEDTLTTTLQDWRKGRRGETDDVNGYVVHWLEKVGKSSPVNQRVVEVAHEIELGKLEAAPSNIDRLLDVMK
jgi:2-dehydropantoate 2-reductase